MPVYDHRWQALRGSTVTWCAVVVLLGNLLDALFTLLFLQLRVAQEINPLMRWAYQSSALGFVLAKLALVQGSLLLLCLNRHLRSAQLAEVLGAGMYTVVLLYHLTCVAHLPVRLSTIFGVDRITVASLRLG